MSSNQLTNLNIETNTNLEVLDITQNELISLDVTNARHLVQLYFGGNQIPTIDVSQNQSLGYLGIGYNNLTTLDVSNNLNLIQLWCAGNNLTSLNISNNSDLTDLNARSNNLTFLDIRNGFNTQITNWFYNTTNNPNLTCIYVDDAQYSQANWTLIDSNSTFVETEEECNALAVNENILQNQLSLYPNPIKNTLTLELPNTTIKEIKIYTVLGKEIVKTTDEKIDMSSFSNGIYIVKITSNDNNIITKKIVKVGL